MASKKITAAEAIRVAIRARPLNRREKDDGAEYVVTVYAESGEVVLPERIGSDLTRTYSFDNVFPPQSRQFELYSDVVMPIVDDVLAGYNCTVFAYGQTGTGKTFSMEGEPHSNTVFAWHEDPQAGIIPRSLGQLFDKLGSEDAEYSVKVSFLQLYNEEIYDLLGEAVDIRDMDKLRLYEHPQRKGSVKVDKLTKEELKTKDDVQDILLRGRQRRITAATRLNDTSSRSHTVFSVTVSITEEFQLESGETEQVTRIGKLNLVDLAGSESIGRSGAENARAREAGQINQSLLALGRVIGALVEGTSHVPYRESKLTRILQDSLGGTSKAYIIATISPSSTCLEETQRTLDFALRAKNITNRPEVTQIRRPVSPLAPIAPEEDVNEAESHVKPSFKLRAPDDDEKIPELMEYYRQLGQRMQGLRGDQERCYYKLQEVVPIVRTELAAVLTKTRNLEGNNRVLQNRNADLRRQMGGLEAKLTEQRGNVQTEQFMRAKMQQIKNTVLPQSGNAYGGANDNAGRFALGETRPKQYGGSTPHLRDAEMMPPPGPGLQRTPRSAVQPRGRLYTDDLTEGQRYRPSPSPARKRVPSPPPKPTGKPVVNPRRHRRSKSAGGTVLDHTVGDNVPTGTFFKSTIPGRKAIRNVRKYDLRKASDYVLRHQNADPDTGVVSTRLYKGEVFPTAAGGSSVIFDDVESLHQHSPTSSQKRASDEPVENVAKKHRKSNT